MQSINQEINNFIESISQKELSRNPKLRRKVKVLLRRINQNFKTTDREIQHHKFLKTYLNREMLKN